MAKSKATDIPMETNDEYSKGYRTVPPPATNAKKSVPPYPKDTQGIPMGVTKVWNKTRPVPGGRPAPATPQKTVPPPDTTPVHQGPGYDDASGIKSPNANVDALTPKRKL